MNTNYNPLDYYKKNAKDYYELSLKDNLESIYIKYLNYLPKNAYILDFGCGSGRDSKYFIERGYKVKAIDGSEELCKLASNYLNQEVICMHFEDLDDINTYDGIWACSSILHVEKELLPSILTKMINSLKPNGIIYTSFKIGTGSSITNGKYYNYIDKTEMIDILNNINKNIKLIDYFETSPTEHQPEQNIIWGNFIIKKYDN